MNNERIDVLAYLNTPCPKMQAVRAAVAELIEREAALRESLRFIAQGHGCPAALATDTLARVQGGSK